MECTNTVCESYKEENECGNQLASPECWHRRVSNPAPIIFRLSPSYDAAMKVKVPGKEETIPVGSGVDAWLDAIPEDNRDPCPCGCGRKWKRVFRSGAVDEHEAQFIKNKEKVLI